jgi:hypothetical protein
VCTGDIAIYKCWAVAVTAATDTASQASAVMTQLRICLASSVIACFISISFGLIALADQARTATAFLKGTAVALVCM